MKDIAEGKIGSDGKYDLELVEGKLKLTVAYDAGGVEAGVSVALNPDYFLDKLAAVIPGQVDDAVIALLKAALKA
jgi:hypothetical protein